MDADVIVLGGWHRTVTRKDVASVQRQLILDEADCPVIVVKRTRDDRS
jgi:nucleotide-binding universal stress UspA family protein